MSIGSEYIDPDGEIESRMLIAVGERLADHIEEQGHLGWATGMRMITGRLCEVTRMHEPLSDEVVASAFRLFATRELVRPELGL